MDIQKKVECEKYLTQVFKWLESRYPDNLYDFVVLEDENFVTAKIEMNVKKEFYEKRGIGILNYIMKTFKRPELIKINWRYNRNMFNINVFCGNSDLEIKNMDE
jgi:hypothetical protein